MKITLIYPEIRRKFKGYTGNYHEGLASLSAMVKKAGHQVFLLHVTRPLEEEDFVRQLLATAPDFVGFSSASNTYPYVREMAPWAKKHFGVPVLYGGVHPTLVPEEALKTEGIDMICVGEGEQPLVELLDSWQAGRKRNDIQSIWFKERGAIITNPVRNLTEDLDELPAPDRSIFDFPNLMSSKDREAYFIASRGCPYPCTYCANHALRENYPNPKSYVRFKSVARIIAEIREVLTQYSFIKYIFFEDDILPLRRAWFQEFAEKYRADVGLPFHCNMHPRLVDEENVELLAWAGYRAVSIGIESGDAFIREEVLGRKVSQEQILAAAHLLEKHGIRIATFNMVGLPLENMRNILQTIKLNASVRPRHAYATIFFPYPGTKLLQVCQENRFLTDRMFDTYAEGTILSQPTLSGKQVAFAHRYFRFLVALYKATMMWPRLTALLDSVFCSKFLPHGLLAGTYDRLRGIAVWLYLTLVQRFHSRVEKLYK